jgi:holo-[acyl-carrier protein] synthase
MSVLGLGLDLIAIDRVERLLEGDRDRVLKRLLTESERSYCESQPLPARHVAARLAAKEAAYKAFQVAEGARGIGWREMEVVRDAEGRPELRFYGRALEAAKRLKVTNAHLSISHTTQMAGAVVVLVRDPHP